LETVLGPKPASSGKDYHYLSWMETHDSKVPDAGTGLFASWQFENGDTLTVYLGHPKGEGDNACYGYKNINAQQ